MVPESDQPCVLCGTICPCWETNGGNARYFKCTNADCGPWEISLDGIAHLREPYRTVKRAELSRKAANTRREGMVLRIWRDHETLQLQDSPKSPEDVK